MKAVDIVGMQNEFYSKFQACSFLGTWCSEFSVIEALAIEAISAIENHQLGTITSVIVSVASHS